MLVRLITAGVYFAASIPKFFNLGLFKATILAYYSFLPDALALAVAIIVPWVEFGLALLLLIDEKWLKWTAGLLMLLSCFYIVNSLIFFNHWMPYGCGCFGFGEAEQLGLGGVVRDALIAAVSVASYAGARSGQSRWHFRA